MRSLSDIVVEASVRPGQHRHAGPAVRMRPGGAVGWGRLVLAGVLLAASLAGAAPAVWPQAQWARSTPEAQGMDARAVAELVRFGQDNGMDSLVLTRHGHLVAEAYYAPFKPGMRHRLNSATKAVVGALTGMALAQGKLPGTEQAVLPLLPEQPLAHASERKSSLTLQHLLDMTSGLAWTEPMTEEIPRSVIAMTRSPNWVQYVLDQPLAREPGEAFHYNSGSSHLLAAVLAQAVGQPLQTYAAQQLFGPLGIEDVKWLRDPQGRNLGGWGLYLQTPDMAKLGYLYLNRGQWDGRQLLPAAWVDRVFQASLPMRLSPNTDWRYADQWWSLPARDAFMAVGLFRQIILVMPKTGVVAAMTGRQHWAFPALLDRVAATVRASTPLPDDAAGQADLQAALAQAASGPVALVPGASPALAQQVSGRTYTLAPNAAGWLRFRLDLGDTPRYELVQQMVPGQAQTSTLGGPLGMDGRFPDGPATARSVARAQWTDERTLSIEVRWPEEGESARFSLRFDQQQVSVDYQNGYGMRAKLQGEASP